MKKGLTYLMIAGILLSPILISISIVLFVPIIVSTLEEEYEDPPPGAIGGSVVCSPTKEINKELWDRSFSKAGVLSSHGDDFIDVAEHYNIDPVLFAAIAFHETGWGTSSAVKNKNNPGGLMNPDGSGLFSYPNLRKGIEAMGYTLNNRINKDGLVTIEDLGSVYAPVGASNDPTNLNIHWVPTVTKYVTELGGLTMNCEVGGEVELIGDKAWPVPYTKRVTSLYGPRSCGGCSKFHRGIDIAESGVLGKPIVSFMDGKVIATGASGTTFHSSSGNMGTGLGYYVFIDHGNGVKTRYGHLQEPSPLSPGDTVRAGEPIGKVGSTGASTAPHLHFEILINDERVDPLPYVKEFNPILP